MIDCKFPCLRTSGVPDANAKNAVQVYGRSVGRGNVASVSSLEITICMVAPSMSSKRPVDVAGNGLPTHHK